MAQEALPARRRAGRHKPINMRGDRGDAKESTESTDHDQWLARAREAYDVSTNFFDTNYRRDWEDSIRHFQGKHMSGSKYTTEAYRYRAKMFRPKSRSLERQTEAATAAAFFSQLDVVSIEPEDPNNPFQEASAALRKAILNYRLSRSVPKGGIAWFPICCGAMQDAYVVGVVASKQAWEYQTREIEEPVLDPTSGQPVLEAESGKPATSKRRIPIVDRPFVKLLPIENVRFDPAADWFDVVNTSPYVIVIEAMRIGDVREKIKAGEWSAVDETFLLAARNNGLDTTRAVRDSEREDVTDPRHSKALSDFDIVWIHEVFMRIDGEEKHFYTLSDLARLTAVRPLEDVYLHGIRPVAMGTCVIESHRAVPDSPTHLAKGLQKETNQVANSRLDNVQLVLNKRWLARRGKQVDLASLVRNAPGSVTLVNDIDKDVFPLEFNDVTASSYKEQDRINLDMDELLGSFSAGSVQSNRTLNETVGGLNLLKGDANSMTQYLIRVFSETWVERVLSQLDMLEQNYEDDEDFLALMASVANLEKDYGITQVTAELLLAPAQVIVNVANSAMDATVRLNVFVSATKLYTEIAQNAPPDLNRETVKKYIYGLLGFRDASQFSVEDQPEDPRIQQLIQGYEQQIQELAQKVQDLKGQYDIKLMEIQRKVEREDEVAAANIELKEAIASADIDLERAKAGADIALDRETAGIDAALESRGQDIKAKTETRVGEVRAKAVGAAAAKAKPASASKSEGSGTGMQRNRDLKDLLQTVAGTQKQLVKVVSEIDKKNEGGRGTVKTVTLQTPDGKTYRGTIEERRTGA